MKNLIIFIALLIIFLSFTVYQQDNNLYILAIETLKNTADEAAGSASLYMDIVFYSEGDIIFNRS